jgi:hypothetical protein
MRADMLDVSDPELVQCIRCPLVVCLQATRGDIELSVQGIVGNDSRAATIRAQLLFVTNMGPYACQTGKVPNPVGADVVSHVAQIIVQLAPYGDCKQSPTGQCIAIHLAAFCPGLSDQRGLTQIFLRAQA